MEGTRFNLLGPMEISTDGRSLPLPRSAERALFAQLLMAANRVVPATALVDRLWSGSALPVDPVNALQTRVSKLRRALAAIGLPDVVVREGIGYRAAVEPNAVDVVDFEQRAHAARSSTGARPEERLGLHEAALSVWRDDPLADFAGESWAATEAARLRALRLTLLVDWAELAMAVRRGDEVVRTLGPLVAADPAHETMAGQLMTALYRAGQQADALEVFARTRSYLDDELGLEPSESLRTVHERVLRQDPSLAVAAPPQVPRTETSVEPTTALTNLPTVERPLIGREERLDELVELLGSSRLVTLVGPGGAGKTSMALVAAVRAAPAFADGVVGVRLGPVDAPERVPSAVGDALSVPVDGANAGSDVMAHVLSFIGSKHLLLVVDNCEHVIDAVAELVEQALDRCAHVAVLATSREALAVPREVQVPVAPLAVPPPGTPPGEVLDHPAAELFVERARSLRPGLRIGDPELLDVAEIVRALDGIPLAVELAAARSSLMSTAEIRSRLGQRFSLLTSGARTASARQRTLKATVDWSYGLLDPVEQRAFERLSVCHGWTLDTAEALLATDPGSDVLHVIARLVEQSMVVADPSTTSRYRMLETLRQYAAERLAESGAGPEVLRLHAEHFRDLALAFEDGVHGPGQAEALRLVGAELPNIEAALDWFECDGDIDSALSMTAALALFWQLRRPLEGRDLLERLLRDGRGDPAIRARALQAVSIVERPRASLVHPSPRCAEAAAESLAVFEAVGDRARAALSKVLVAVEGVGGTDVDHYSRLLDEADADFSRVGRDGDDWGRAYVAYVRMEIALKHGRPETAVELGTLAASAFRRIDDQWGLSGVLQHLGRGMRELGRYDESDSLLEEALVASEAADKDATVPWVLAEIGILRAYQGRYDEAEDAFDRAVVASLRVGDGAGDVLAAHGAGLVRHLQHDWDAARSSYTSAIEGFRELGTPEMEAFSLCGRALCHEALGRPEQADLDYRAALALGRTWHEPAVITTALDGLARSAHRTGDQDAASGFAAEAADLKARSGRVQHALATVPT